MAGGRAGRCDHLLLARAEWQDSGERLAFCCPLTAEAELRLLLPHYAEEMYALVDRNRAHLHVMSWVETTTCAAHYLGFMAARAAADGGRDGDALGDWYRGCFAGTIGTLPMNWHSRRAEFGYWLGEEFQGHGIMTAAARAMLAHLFTEMELNRAELHIRTGNTRSRAVAERLGFTREGIQRQANWSNGKPVDMACYALLREEWEQQQCR